MSIKPPRKSDETASSYSNPASSASSSSNPASPSAK
jgi:hypothetical protein